MMGGVEMENLLDITKQEIVAKGKIVKIEIANFEEAFKNPEKVLAKTRDPERAKSRKYAVITVKTDNTEFTESHGLPKGSSYDPEKNEWTVTDQIALRRSMLNYNNWFVKFIKKYNQNPKVGMEVEVVQNQQGFLRIAVV